MHQQNQRGPAFAPNQFVFDWARQQETPTAAFYKSDVLRERSWQLRVEPNKLMLVSARSARANQLEKNGNLRQRITLAAMHSRSVAYNATPKGIELGEARKMRNAVKAARRWRRSGK